MAILIYDQKIINNNKTFKLKKIIKSYIYTKLERLYISEIKCQLKYKPNYLFTKLSSFIYDQMLNTYGL